MYLHLHSRVTGNISPTRDAKKRCIHNREKRSLPVFRVRSISNNLLKFDLPLQTNQDKEQPDIPLSHNPQEGNKEKYLICTERSKPKH